MLSSCSPVSAGESISPPSPTFLKEGLRPPAVVPEIFTTQFKDNVPRHLKLAECDFDASVHLQIEPPATVKSLEFRDVPFPYTDDDFPGLAYTTPFRLLSDEGVAVVRSIVDSNGDLVSSNARNTCIRGLGYRSKFIRDFVFSDEVVGIFSALANKPIWPHNCLMNLAHTNFGAPGQVGDVDKWHTDSVDYVNVLILSDSTDMEGGELQVLQLPNSNGNAFDEYKVIGIPADLVETVKCPKAGHCVLMQGSLILHRVTSVKSAREPRISMINSFGPRDVFAKDQTRLNTFRELFKDPKEVANLEFARHKAWRCAGKMEHLMNNVEFGTDAEHLADILKDAGQELLQSSRLILGEESDHNGSNKSAISGDDNSLETKANNASKARGATRSRL